MQSATPKPLHRLCGRAMVLYVLDALAELVVDRVVVVVGPGATEVTKTIQAEASHRLAFEFVEQPEPARYRRRRRGRAHGTFRLLRARRLRRG